MNSRIHNSVPQASAARDIVVVETNSGEPSRGDFERMARRRFQDPKPVREGKWWYLLTWQDCVEKGRRVRKRKRIKLAPSTMSVREAQRVAAEMLRPLNQGLISPGAAVQFGEFIDSVYEPTVMPLLSSTTRSRSTSVIKVHLRPMFGDACLRDLGPLVIQRYLSGLAGSALSDESRDKIKDVLSSILGSAVQYGFLVKNPVEGLRLPRSRKGRRNKPYITPSQFEALVALISEPYATMVYVAVHTGLRVSELAGLKWQNVHFDSITIDERYSRGDWSAPKSASSNATVPVDRAVAERIELLKTLVVDVRAGRATRHLKVVKSEGPGDLVFQSLVKAAPMRDNNILVRHLKPAAEKLGLGLVNWQVLRRSFATWLDMAGASVKDAQALMRHSRASTTLDVYQQCVPESQRRAVQNLDRLTRSVPVVN
jgi:integrase